jgi:hypothetical protein
MGDIRVKVANFAVEMFPHMPDTVQALRCLISVATEIIEDITALEQMMSLPVGTVSDEDPPDCSDSELY